MATDGVEEWVALSPSDAAVLSAAVDRLVPAHGSHPGAAALGAVHFIDLTLGAFAFDPPRIWAGGPFSGRAGGTASYAGFERLTARDELAWRTRIEGSRGDPSREWNGPVRGWQEIYRDGIAALGRDFPDCDGAEQDRRLEAVPADFRRLLYEHVCEGCYGAPEYGGNVGGRGWEAIEWPGDTQPRGWTDDEVTRRD